VTHNSSRKQFFGKLLGAIAASTVVTKAVAKPAAGDVGTTATVRPSSGRFELRHDARAVARRDSV
jgi:hypothetical protein